MCSMLVVLYPVLNNITSHESFCYRHVFAQHSKRDGRWSRYRIPLPLHPHHLPFSSSRSLTRSIKFLLRSSFDQVRPYSRPQWLLCHTDSTVTAGKFPTNLPCTTSHEGTGEVKAVGSNVKDFKPATELWRACRKIHAESASEDWHQYSQNIEGHIGILIDGAFAEHVVVDLTFSAKALNTLSRTSAAPLASA